MEAKVLHLKDWFYDKIGEILKSIKSVKQTSYDIVKAHGGELKVESKEGEGSEFMVEIPFV